MRAKTLAAMLVMLMLTLSGCTEKKDDATDDVDCEDLLEQHEAGDLSEADYLAAGCEAEHGGSDVGGEDTNVTDEPNIDPVAVLTMTDSAGNVLDANSFIMDGDSITFSAAGTSDEDGVISVAGLAVAIVRPGETDLASIPQPATATLMANDVATDFTMNFTGQQGHIIAVLSALDDDGGRDTAVAETWQNTVQTLTFDITGADPTGQQKAESCSGPGEGIPDPGSTPLIDQQFSSRQKFEAKNSTRWVEASIVDADAKADIAICSPAKEAMSGSGQSVSSEDSTLTQSVDYAVFAVAREPDQQFSVDVIVHWEPKPAA